MKRTDIPYSANEVTEMLIEQREEQKKTRKGLFKFFTK